MISQKIKYDHDDIVRAESMLIVKNRKSKRQLRNKYNWKKIARPKQLPPEGLWKIWMILAGRGFGKSRAATEWTRMKVEEAKSPINIAIVGRTPADVRDVLIEGESGLLNISPAWNRPLYEPSKRKLTWNNGSVAHTYSFENPDQLRGPQHHFAIVDELASAADDKSWDNLMFGLRSGINPQVMITTTPRPTQIIKSLLADKSNIITRGSTYENKDNLAASYIEFIEDKYANTRLGRQEIYAEILDDVEGALWKFELIEKNRVQKAPIVFKRVVVAIDPAVTSNKKSDETGIIVAGLGEDDHGYILADSSMRGTPSQWASEALRLYDYHEANLIVGEVNNGGDMVENTIKTVAGKNHPVMFKKIYSSRGKMLRAEPIVSLDEQGKVHHVGVFAKLEDQMCAWSPTESDFSPDRVDARVFALTELMVNDAVEPRFTVC